MEEGLLTGKGITRQQVAITLYSPVQQENVMRWTLRDAFPVKWVGPSFKAGEASVAIESLEFAHNGIALD
jgi:phage tail-like protein